MRPGFRPRRAQEFSFLPLESRTMLSWSQYAQLISQDAAVGSYSSITGQGQTVAVIDTGIDYTHASLGGGFGAGHKVIAGYDFLDNDADPMDEDGHGTSVAGMIAAEQYTYQGVTYQGIAPDANLVALRVGTEDSISDNNIEKALQWVVANHATYNITVVNLSLGSGAYSSDFTNAQLSDEFASLADLNIAVFAASGNSGRSRISGNGVSFPASDPNVVAVGAVTASDALAEYTQRGSELDLLAPGDNVVSTALNGAYDVVSGTSFASPIAAGVAALVKQVAGWLTENEVTSIIRTSGVTNYDGDNETGRVSAREYSRLDVFSAVRRAIQLTTKTSASLSVDRSTTVDSAYDLDGVLHVAYYDKASGSVLLTTELSTGRWSRPVTASSPGVDAGTALSLAIDQAGKPAIAYYDSTNQDLRLATFDRGAFSTVAVDTAGDVGQYVSLAFDSSGDTLISYYDATNQDLKVATGDRRSGYTSTTVDSSGDVGAFSSIAAVDSGGTTILAVAYADNTNGNLKYTRTSTGAAGWTAFVADDLDGVANIDLSLEGGRAAIAYRDTLRGDVKYAYRNDTWFAETISAKGSLGQSVDLYYDLDGTPHVAYYNRTKDATYDASRSASGVWSSTRIGTGGKAITVADSVNSDVSPSRLVLDRTRNLLRPLDDEPQ